MQAGAGETEAGADGIGILFFIQLQEPLLKRAGELELLVDPAEGNNDQAAVDAFVGDLPETERRIFIARYWFLIPVKEIAERLGCTQSRVKTSLYRTRKKLCVYLEDEELC